MSSFFKRLFGRAPKGRSFFAVAAALMVLAVFAAVPATAVLTGSPSNFESGNDPTIGVGNELVDTTGDADWITVQGDANYVHLSDKFNSTSDDSFTPGQKQDTTCPSVQGHKNSPKDDFTDVASFNETAANGDIYLYGATLRYASNGNASENIELKQGTSGFCQGSTTLLARTPGDKLLAIDYLGGGSAVQFHLLEWVASGACNVSNDTAPCWGATVLALSPAVAEGGVSITNFTAAQNPISNVPIVAGQFAEFGVNLNEAGIIPNTGTCAGFAQTVWESRASGSSFVSSTKDVSVEDHSISSCASVAVTKVGSDGGSQAGAVFTLYAGTGTGGAVIGTCTVLADGTCPSSEFSNLNPGTYTLDETTVPAGYTKDATLPFTFTLAAGDNASYEFTDVLNTGAINIVKTAKHADANTAADLGAGFTVTDSNGDTHTVSTDSTTGLGCIDGLPPGSATVSETSPPTGYNPADDVTVTVVGNTTCTGGDGVEADFVNVPLTDVTVGIDSQVPGGTSTTVTCDDPSTSTMTTGANGDGSLSIPNQEPSTIHCTIVIDP